MRISFFSGSALNSTDFHTKELTFKELAEELTTPRYGKTKHDGYIVRGEIQEDGKRCNKDLINPCLLVIDGDCSIDDPDSAPPPSDVHETLKGLGITHFIYTTHSHMPPEKNKFRAMIPCELSDGNLKGSAKSIIDLLNQHDIPIKYVKEMGTMSQPWFAPNRQEDDGKFESYIYLDGESYDPVENTVNQKLSPTNHEDSMPFDQKVVEMYTRGTYHNHLRDLITGMIRDGMAPTMCLAIVKGLMEAAPLKNESWHRECDNDYAEIKRSIEGIANHTDVEDVIPDLSAALPKELVKDVEWPPGRMGKLAKSVYDYSDYPYKLVSIITALGLVGGIAGRKYNVSNTGCNIYITLLMPTGSGKDVIQKFITNILTQLNPLSNGSQFLGSKNHTGPKALLDELKEKPSIIAIYTEAGMLFKSSAGDSHGLLRAILDLYSSSGANQHSLGERYSNTDNSIVTLRAPCLSIINEATPATFINELSSRGSIESGELARMHIFRYEVTKPYLNDNPGDLKLDKGVKDRIIQLMAECGGQSAIGGDNDPKPKQLKYPRPLFKEFEKSCVDEENRCMHEDSLRKSMVSRAPLKALKVAALLAIMDGTDITEEHWKWSLKLYHYEISLLAGLFGDGIDTDIDNTINSVVMPAIVRVMNDDFGDKKKSVNREMRKRKLITYSVINQCVRNNARIKDLNTNYKNGVRTCIDHMLYVGYLEEVDVGPFMQVKGSTKGYRLTNSFYVAWESK